VAFVFFLAAVLASLAAWRWGGWLFGGLATCGVLGFLTQAPAARWMWFLLGLTLFAGLLWLGDRAFLAPSQRASARAGMVVALAAVYVALNYASVERGAFEHMLAPPEGAAPPVALGGLLVLGGVATALLPLAALALGVARRDRLVLGCGVLLAAASLVTLRFYVHLMPLWALLVLVGVALGGLGLALRRFLGGGTAHERDGFTAEPLLEGGKRQFIEIAATVGAFAPAARVPAESPGGFAGAGGASGGGGATTDF
jgi:hypothetical protein